MCASCVRFLVTAIVHTPWVIKRLLLLESGVCVGVGVCNVCALHLASY